MHAACRMAVIHSPCAVLTLEACGRKRQVTKGALVWSCQKQPCFEATEVLGRLSRDCHRGTQLPIFPRNTSRSLILRSLSARYNSAAGFGAGIQKHGATNRK